MALKSTIYKAHLQLADMDRQVYADHALTLARHPSETEERLMVRLLAFALWAPADEQRGRLDFGKGLSDTDEPDLWQRDLSGDIVQWIRIEGAVTELYDVAVLPGVRRPMAASFTGPEINEPMTFEM